MTRRISTVAIVLAALGLGLALWVIFQKTAPPSSPIQPPTPKKYQTAQASVAKPDSRTLPAESPAPAPSLSVTLIPALGEIVAELNDPAQPPTHDLEILQNLLGQYRRIFGENPPGGENSEITAAMLGSNPRKLAVLPTDLPALNSRGELRDRWGTPYYFHPVSRIQMGLLSAGPDRQLWTTDDLGTLEPAGGN